MIARTPLQVEKMYNELLRDNDDIIDAIGEEEIQKFVDLLKIDKNPHYLEFLAIICECNETAKIEHQKSIVKLLLEMSKGVVYLTELTADRADVRISVSGLKTDWVSLREYDDLYVGSCVIYPA